MIIIIKRKTVPPLSSRKKKDSYDTQDAEVSTATVKE